MSRVTGLTLQMAAGLDDPVVLGGFPLSGLNAHAGQLLRPDHSAAVAVHDATKDRQLAEQSDHGASIPP